MYSLSLGKLGGARVRGNRGESSVTSADCTQTTPSVDPFCSMWYAWMAACRLRAAIATLLSIPAIAWGPSRAACAVPTHTR